MSNQNRIGKIIQKAIKDNDIATLKILKDALDEVHSTGNSVELKKPKIVITPANLPPDEDYESICKILQTPLRIAPAIPNAKMSILPDLWMGSFPKPDSIKQCLNGIMIPKFDGCSAGLKFVRNGDGEIVLQMAQTRGAKANITSKMDLLVGELKKALNDHAPFKDVPDLMICFRGEVVAKSMEGIDSSPAPYVAGKVNGGEDVFKDALDNLEFVPYEIMRLTKFTKKIRVTQKECFELLEDLNQLKFEPIKMKDYNLAEVKSAFERFQKDLSEPLDGVVYCSENWTYPITEAETMPASYGKWAWKPSKEDTTRVSGFEYSMARDGKIEISMTYEEIKIDNKKYSKAKTSISRLLALKGIGIGSEVIIRIANGISPFVADFIPDPSITEYTLPKKCPFCRSTLKLTTGANCTLKCPNVNCSGVKLQKYKNFLKVLGFKGISDKTLQKLSELTFEELVKEHFDEKEFKKTVLNSTVHLLFQALGFGGKQTVQKTLKNTPLKDKGEMKVSQCLREIEEALEEIVDGDGDEFLEDFYNVITEWH